MITADEVRQLFETNRVTESHVDISEEIRKAALLGRREIRVVVKDKSLRKELAHAGFNYAFNKRQVDYGHGDVGIDGYNLIVSW